MIIPSIFNNFDSRFDEMFYSTTNYNIENLEDKYQICMDVPGVTKENTSITIKNGLLTVLAERKGSRATTFKSTFKMPSNASNEVDASLTDGVLTLTLPKTENTKAKTIQVR